MKLRDLYRINSRRAFLFSVLVHLVILTVLTTATLQLTTPEGLVLENEIELSNTGAGEPIPVEVKPAPEVKEPKKDEPPQKIVDEVPVRKPEMPKVLPTKKIVDEAKNEQPSEKASNWTPVEETDIDDSESASESDQIQEQTKEEVSETPPAPAETSVEESPSAGNNGEGLGSGPVRSEKELSQAPGNPAIAYPYLARVQRIEGTVVLRFTLNADGSISKVWVHKSSGSQLLDKAVSTFAKWKYQSGSEGVFEKKLIFRLVGPAEQMPAR